MLELITISKLRVISTKDFEHYDNNSIFYFLAFREQKCANT